MSSRRVILGLVLLVACGTKPAPPPAPSPAPSPPAVKLDRVSRARFNMAAAEHFLPLFWVKDTNEDGALTVDELAVLWGLVPTTRSEWVVDGKVTPAFQAAYDKIAATSSAGP